MRTQDNSDTHRKTPSCRSRSESKHKERPDTERRRNPRPEEIYVADRKTDEHPIDQEERRSSRRQAATVVIVMKKIEPMIIAEEETEGQIVFDEEIIR